jgi:hypothetical protein
MLAIYEINAIIDNWDVNGTKILLGLLSPFIYFNKLCFMLTKLSTARALLVRKWQIFYRVCKTSGEGHRRPQLCRHMQWWTKSYVLCKNCIKIVKMFKKGTNVWKWSKCIKFRCVLCTNLTFKCVPKQPY